jgi:hypothetical protein
MADRTKFHLKDPLVSSWVCAPKNEIPFDNDTLAFINTKVPNGRFYVNERFLSHIDQNLKGNPYVNNLIHRSSVHP